jgi:hypothetical protein
VKASQSTPEPSSSEDESSDDEMEPPPYPEVRSNDPVKAAGEDAARALWHPKSSPYLEDEVLRQSMAKFSEIFGNLRETWRTSTQELKAATESKNTAQVSSLKKQLEDQRQISQATLESALEHGHPDVLTMYVLPLAFPLAVTRYFHLQMLHSVANAPGK